MNHFSPLVLSIVTGLGMISVVSPRAATAAEQHLNQRSAIPPLPSGVASSDLPRAGIFSTLKRTALEQQIAARPATITLYRVLVQPRSSARQTAQVQHLVSGAFRSSYKGRSVLQVGLYRDKDQAEQMRRLMRQHGLKALLTPRTGSSTQPAPPHHHPWWPSPLCPHRAESRWAELIMARISIEEYRLPPPQHWWQLAPGYRVVIQPPRTQRQQTRLRTLVPDAFRSSYRGRRVIQVGSFPSRSEASQRMQLLQTIWLSPYPGANPLIMA